LHSPVSASGDGFQRGVVVGEFVGAAQRTRDPLDL
jgi:hypothetical protein